MAIPGFFKQNKPRGFNYVPRYYDPVKEELEERRKAWDAEKSEQGSDNGLHRADNGEQGKDLAGGSSSGSGTSTHYRSKIMRGDMKNYFHRKKERVQKYTLIRILVIALIMILAIYFYLRF